MESMLHLNRNKEEIKYKLVKRRWKKTSFEVLKIESEEGNLVLFFKLRGLGKFLEKFVTTSTEDVKE